MTKPARKVLDQTREVRFTVETTGREMALIEQSPSEHHDALSAENARLLAQARHDRIRHEGSIREAERKFRSGLELIRKATLRVVSSQ
jgi:hypothetical protein